MAMRRIPPASCADGHPLTWLTDGLAVCTEGEGFTWTSDPLVRRPLVPLTDPTARVQAARLAQDWRDYHAQASAGVAAFDAEREQLRAEAEQARAAHAAGLQAARESHAALGTAHNQTVSALQRELVAAKTEIQRRDQTIRQLQANAAHVARTLRVLLEVPDDPA